jgi:hypothetical protein
MSVFRVGRKLSVRGQNDANDPERPSTASKLIKLMRRHMPSDNYLTLAVVGIPDSLCVANASAKPSSEGRVLACGLFTCDIQQSLPA